MTTLWYLALTIGGTGYLFLVGTALTGLFKLLSKQSKSSSVITEPQSQSYPFVSVVIAARNEENNISATLGSLLKQDYPVECYEIIVVDDRSSDGTADIIREFAQTHPYIKLVQQENINPAASPKKQALEAGIRRAKGEIIITTDADCLHNPQWIRALLKPFSPSTGMVIGQARFETGEKPPLWQRLQSLDYNVQGILSAGLISAGMPFNCTGASFAFRKELFEDVDGWNGVNHLISGDDELLLAKAHRRGWKIDVATDQAAVVLTQPPADIRELWNQRIRWGSKGLQYSPSRTFVLALVFLFYLAMSIGLVMFVFGVTGMTFLKILGLKAIFDWMVLKAGSKLFGDKVSLIDFLILEPIHLVAIVLFSLFGHFSGYEWKGQHFRAQGAADN